MPDHFSNIAVNSYQALPLVYKKVQTSQLSPFMPISSQNSYYLGEETNANYLGVTSCYQFHIYLSLNTALRPQGHSKQVCAVVLKEAGRKYEKVKKKRGGGRGRRAGSKKIKGERLKIVRDLERLKTKLKSSLSGSKAGSGAVYQLLP